MTDRVGYPILTEKTIRLLERNQYSFDVDVRSDKKEVKEWIELFFDVKVIAVNSHRLPGKKRKIGAIAGYTARYKRVIVKLQSGYSIPLFSDK
uniref:ribosomal protein L23 n=1 Tax=Pellia epiphylla TaxID=40340 RepID=UPI00257DA49A|nr:ribosomal protein L23 [Pellia epiphylla]WIA67426.1 ribosomal protein L23 [Pellia epiphylla var. borealis]WIA67511.1 ribosomal protein L23 [Pellia epiphylla var. borealis]WIA67949.1 ribosomal protein L23 [Pellia epiphylla]WIA68034.1 ribosomal protein L23 [Pellia epiphylla]WIA68120.1 ribosomal protein L23 [Pellia epiphylla]